MSTFELAPTIENFIQTLNDNIVNRNDDVVNFYRLLHFREGHESIALDGQWGSGKTFFVNQVILLAKALNKNTNFPEREQILASLNVDECFKSKFSNDYLVVYYDAWYNDNDEDPLLSVLFEICKQANKDFILNGEILARTGNILSQIIKMGTKIDLEEFVDSFKSHSKLAEYVTMREYNDKIADLLNTISNGKVILFIDELDRCKPTYAVKLLERVKRYFNKDNFICVYSLNLQQLQHTVKCVYGAEFAAHKYLDRFFSLTVPIPEYSQFQCIESFIPPDLQNIPREVIHEIIMMFGFSIREIAHYSEQLSTAIVDIDKFYKNMDTAFIEGKYSFLIRVYVIPLVMALRIHDIDLYYDFINGKNKQPLMDLFNRGGVNNYLLRFVLEQVEAYDKFSDLTEEELNKGVDILYEACFCEDINDKSQELVTSRSYGRYKDYILKIVGCMSDVSIK